MDLTKHISASTHRPITAIGILAAGATMLAITPAASASHNLHKSNYGKSGRWSVVMVSNDKRFMHCRATAKSGRRKGIGIFASKKSWGLKLYNKGWSKRANSAPGAYLSIDGRLFMEAAGRMKNRMISFYLGSTQRSVEPLMSGQMLVARLGSKQTSFSLRGAKAAAELVARCRARGLGLAAQPKTQDLSAGAASPNARPATASKQTTAKKPIKMDRKQTFKVAQAILNRTGQTYTIIPERKNRMTDYPVNFKTAKGIYGGVMVYANAPWSPAQAIAGIVAAQSRTCRDRLTVTPKSQKFKNGSELFTAKIVCETATRRQVINHEAIRNKNNVLVVIARINPPKLKKGYSIVRRKELDA